VPKTYEASNKITEEEALASIAPYREATKERIRRCLRRNGPTSSTRLGRRLEECHPAWRYVLEEMADAGEVVCLLKARDGSIKTYIALKEEEKQATG
jgi:hypothetical protein